MTPPELNPNRQHMAPESGGALKRSLLLLNVIIMAIGGFTGPLFSRMYFLHGGRRIWLSTFLQNCGFPILLFPLIFSYLRQQKRRKGHSSSGIFSITGKAAVVFIVLGVITGVDGYMYAYGSASLPLSTSALLISTQVAFTAAFAYLIVRQRLTAYSINAVVLMVMGSIVLGLQAGGDRPPGVSQRRYYLGFFSTLGSAAVLGLLMPLIEQTWMNMKEEKVTHVMVLEMQTIIAVAATAFSTVGMLVNKDFQAIPREAEVYALGETKYHLVLAASAIGWQLLSVGTVGIILCSSSLLSGILYALLVPLGEILPVLVLHEKFNSEKGVSMVLAFWGFISYLYGEYWQHKREKQTAAEVLELTTLS